jgi:HEPN domain-containing protein
MKANSDYWITEAKESFASAEVLFDGKRYLEAAFFCHLAIEKALKAFVAERTEQIPPKTHNLSLLAEMGLREEQRTEELMSFLFVLMPYQLESRYPSDRLRILKATPPAKFREIINRTREVLSCLKQMLK